MIHCDICQYPDQECVLCGAYSWSNSSQTGLAGQVVVEVGEWVLGVVGA